MVNSLAVFFVLFLGLVLSQLGRLELLGIVLLALVLEGLFALIFGVLVVQVLFQLVCEVAYVKVLGQDHTWVLLLNGHLVEGRLCICPEVSFATGRMVGHLVVAVKFLRDVHVDFHVLLGENQVIVHLFVAVVVSLLAVELHLIILPKFLLVVGIVLA